MTTPTSEILNKAADIIETRGWTTGGMTDDPWGEKSEEAPICLEGGIAVAFGVRLTGRNLLSACPAARAVHAYLEMRGDDVLWQWNDGYPASAYQTTRTAPEVIEVLRATALIEQARENSSVTEKVSA